MHGIGNNGGVVPNERILAVRRLGADLLVSVTEGTTNGLGETNLSTGLKEVLSSEDIFGSELTESPPGKPPHGGGEKRRDQTPFAIPQPERSRDRWRRWD